MSSRNGKRSLASSLLGASKRRQEPRRSALGTHLPHALQLARGSLRAKFILVIVSLIIALMGAVMFVVDRHQHQAVLEQARLRAFSLAKGLAAVSEGYLLSYNFIQLEQAIENMQADEEDVVYAVAHLRDGKVAVFSGRSD